MTSPFTHQLGMLPLYSNSSRQIFLSRSHSDPHKDLNFLLVCYLYFVHKNIQKTRSLVEFVGKTLLKLWLLPEYSRTSREKRDIVRPTIEHLLT